MLCLQSTTEQAYKNAFPWILSLRGKENNQTQESSALNYVFVVFKCTAINFQISSYQQLKTHTCTETEYWFPLPARITLISM